VHLVRDGRDCGASLKGMRWWHHGTVAAAAMWAHSVDCARRAQRRLPADAFIEVRYEDLVADPRAALERLAGFLGEDFEEAMLAPHVQAERLPRRQREVWHSQTLQAVTTSRTGTHAEALTSAEIALVERVAGSRLRRLGYEVGAGPGPADRPQPADVARFTRTLASMRLRTRALAAYDRRLSLPRDSVADRGRAGPGHGAGRSSIADTPVIRWTAKDRKAPRRWSYALTCPPSTVTGSMTRWLPRPSAST